MTGDFVFTLLSTSLLELLAGEIAITFGERNERKSKS